MVIIVFNFLPCLQTCPTSFMILSRRIFTCRRSVQRLWLHKINKVHHFYLWVTYLLWCYVYICSSFLYTLYTKKMYGIFKHGILFFFKDIASQLASPPQKKKKDKEIRMSHEFQNFCYKLIFVLFMQDMSSKKETSPYLKMVITSQA